jgi:hypothetical protein
VKEGWKEVKEGWKGVKEAKEEGEGGEVSEWTKGRKSEGRKSERMKKGWCTTSL